jgi:methyl-accepting chemotaxis protein
MEIDQVADLIHELQKERGYSAGYTASNGINFADRLTAQRRETDAVLANTAESLEELSAAHPETMARLRTGLSELRAWRSRIDAGEVTVPELAGYYTGVVNTALELQSEVVNTMAASELERITRAALYVTRAKEAAGLERAMGATGLGAAEFPHDVFNRFIELGAVQLTTLNRAQDEIGDPDFTRVILSHPSHAAIEEQREIIRGAMTGLRQPILTAGSWFETSTAWIDYLRDVESGLKTTAIASAAEIYADLRAKRTRIIAASGIAIVFAISLAVAGFERVIYRVKRLTKAMYRFTEGEFDVWIPGINDRDEVGEMAAAVYAFKQETLAMRKAAAEQKVDDEAIILGKAQRVVDLLTEGLAALAQADLTRHFDERLDAEYDSIRIDFNTATARLREVTEAIVTTAVDLDARAGELLRSSAALGERTVEQVNTIDATNARVGQLSQEVEAYAGNVSDAARLAASAKDTADRSGEVVRSAVDAMSRISASSQEIGRIISMIEARRMLSRDDLEPRHVDHAAVGDLERRDHRQREEGQLQERLRSTTPSEAAARAAPPARYAPPRRAEAHQPRDRQGKLGQHRAVPRHDETALDLAQPPGGQRHVGVIDTHADDVVVVVADRGGDRARLHAEAADEAGGDVAVLAVPLDHGDAGEVARRVGALVAIGRSGWSSCRCSVMILPSMMPMTSVSSRLAECAEARGVDRRRLDRVPARPAARCPARRRPRRSDHARRRPDRLRPAAFQPVEATISARLPGAIWPRSFSPNASAADSVAAR